MDMKCEEESLVRTKFSSVFLELTDANNKIKWLSQWYQKWGKRNFMIIVGFVMQISNVTMLENACF